MGDNSQSQKTMLSRNYDEDQEKISQKAPEWLLSSLGGVFAPGAGTIRTKSLDLTSIVLHDHCQDLEEVHHCPLMLRFTPHIGAPDCRHNISFLLKPRACLLTYILRSLNFSGACSHRYMSNFSDIATESMPRSPAGP